MMEQGGLKVEPLFAHEGWHVEYDGEWWTFSVLKEKQVVGKKSTRHSL